MASKVISESPVACFELKKELERIKKRDGELNYRSNKTEEYLNNVLPQGISKDGDVIIESLTKLNIARLRDMHIKKIVDIYPKSIKEVRAILQGYNITLSSEQLQKIVDIFQ